MVAGARWALTKLSQESFSRFQICFSSFIVRITYYSGISGDILPAASPAKAHFATYRSLYRMQQRFRFSIYFFYCRYFAQCLHFSRHIFIIFMLWACLYKGARFRLPLFLLLLASPRSMLPFTWCIILISAPTSARRRYYNSSRKAQDCWRI